VHARDVTEPTMAEPVAESYVVNLSRIAARISPLAEIGEASGVVVTDVAFDHREVRPGALFCCIVGEHHDGHDFAIQAARAGASAFICEHSLGSEVGSLPQLVVAPGAGRSAMAQAACEFFGDPAKSMTTVGITGTNGKTTTSFILRSIFERAGMSSRVVGTLDGARTTPEAPVLQRTLAGFRSSGVQACAIEVSSHALVMHRVDAMRFDVAVFTNLSQDHLDYHETMEAYFQAKAVLFEPELARLAVVNADDRYGQRLIEHAAIPTVSFSIGDAHELNVGLDASTFRLGGVEVRLPLGGRFNVANALGAAAAARALGISVSAIVEGLESVSVVPGRFEVQVAENGVTAVVDFAHTPNGLEELLRAAHDAARGVDGSGTPNSGRVVVVFGCGGDRDRGKRPAMGAIASQLADEVVLTSDNPRSEDPLAIIGEIQAGISCSTPVRVEPDRRAAIFGALRNAEAGDVVVIAGKGHESVQQFADFAVTFDDRNVVREAVATLARQDSESPSQTGEIPS
jgi:UDP-N-acetylmuramoyl-L-alanyl-D-glutamate--2,6-diaminopimelate ligase